MPDTANGSALTLPIEQWLLPLGPEEPCGPDLEYDPDMLELQQLAAGKPETQFAPAEPPEWNAVREKAAALMNRTRDLRVAMYWCRAHVSLEGFAGVPAALCLLQGCWTPTGNLHPMTDPEDGDTFARISAVGGLDKLDGLLGDVRQALVTTIAGWADCACAASRSRPTAAAAPRREHRARAADRGLSCPRSPKHPRPGRRGAALGQAPHVVMNDRFGTASVDLKRLRGMLTVVASVPPGRRGR